MAAPHLGENGLSAISEQKRALRQAALALRARLDGAAIGRAVGERLAASGLIAPGAAIAGVWPMPGEIDLRPFLSAMHDAGHPILLPETTPRGQALRFRRWRPGCVMLRERFGTERPDGPEGVPDVVLVPLLAFDRRGYRLGYGGGYYDITLATLPGATAIGFAAAAQEVAAVPAEPHDVALGRIATETDIIATGAGRTGARRGD